MKTSRFFVLKIITIIFSPIVLTFCQDTPNNIDEFILDDGSIILFDDNKDIILFKDYARIDTVFIKSDTLFLRVLYSGGCQVHKFKLFGSRSILKSNPPQMKILLSHNANGDGCRMLITDTLKFSIKPIKNFMMRTYNMRGPIMLLIYEPLSLEYYQPIVTYNF